jgi:hypothetical protein
MEGLPFLPGRIVAITLAQTLALLVPVCSPSPT